MVPGGARLARAAPPVAALGAVAASAGAIVLHASASPGGPPFRFADLVVGISLPLAGAVVLRHERRNRAGWLLVLCAVLALDPLLNQVAWHLLGAGATAQGAARTAGQACLWLANWIWAPYLLLPTLLVLLLPEGRPPQPRGPLLARCALGCTALAAVAAMFRPGGADQIDSLHNPLGIAGASFLGPLEALGAGLAVAVLAPLCLAGLFVRQRRAAGRERAQLQWLAAGAVGAAAGLIGSALAPFPAGEVLLAAGLLCVPFAIAIAAWRHQLFDVQVVLNRAVVSFVLALLGLGVYALLILGIGDRLAPAAAAVVALLAASVFGRAQRLAARLLFGARDEPYTVVERLGDRLESESAPAAALETLVQTVRESLRLPYVAVTASDPDLASASVGRVVAGDERFPCTARGETLGELAVGHRHRGERWRPDERSLLVETARRAGALLELSRVLRHLEGARNRVVAAREEERRRLRRELHDGIASALAGITLQLDVLADDASPALAEPLGRLHRRTGAVAEEVRGLVEELRPPALDALGLRQAVREHAALWERPGATNGARLEVGVRAEPLPPLPAATELAAYRIATEAVTNVGRHAHASTCRVTLSVMSPWLVVEVIDDGHGFTGGREGGVGLSAMRERAEEVGGQLIMDSTLGSGTRLVARLPLEIT